VKVFLPASSRHIPKKFGKGGTKADLPYGRSPTGAAYGRRLSSEFLLMAIFSQTFFALVRGDLMPFTLFTTGQGLSPPLLG
jgi:hypothetical protein